jgi:hypothetical protein
MSERRIQINHPQRGFTWKRGITYSRLDYTFISEELGYSIISLETDWVLQVSDHAAVKSGFKIDNILKKGPSILKVNV